MSNSLASVHPELIPEWSERNLPLTPDKITFGSNKRVWWKGACGHEWETSVKARSKGEKCPICSGARVIEGINDLVTLKPLLAQEWSEKNKLKPTEVSVASHKKIIWKCKHGHEWEASVKSRTINGTGCPYCSHNKVLAGFNDLASQYPDIAAEWSDRNLPLLPTMVTAFANSKAWWKCKDCGNEWHTLISTRSGGSRCPYCSGYTLLKGFNDLATTHPDIAAEWSERNYPLMPDEVNAKSRHNVWWKCKTCGNEWKSVINARVKGTVCPVCADRTVLAGYNDLATTDRKLLAEWDYEKNSLLPTQVSRRSMKRVWWKCSLGHSWKAKISDRTIIGEKCTVCEKEYRSVFPGLAVAYYANQKGLKVQLGSDKLLGIPLETYIPSEKLAIEFTNGSEHMEVLKSHLCKQRNITSVQNHTKVPSFCTRSSGSAKVNELEWNGSKYVATLTDTNGVLGNYNFSANIDGVSFSVSGNKLTVSMEKAPSKEFTITAAKKNGVRRGVVVWSDGIHQNGNGIQDVVTYAQEVSDPVSGFVKMKVSYGSCQIVKTSEDGKVDGIQFTVSGNGVNQTVTTANGGKFQLDNLMPGVYTVTEQSIDKYVPQEVHRVTVVAGQVSKVNFNNVLKRGNLQVIKSSEDNLVEGVTFHLYGTSLAGIAVDEYAVTDKNGVASFDDVLISGTTPYTIEEVDTAIRYVVPANQTAPINWKEVTTRNFTNILKKFSVTVTKSDREEGTPQGDATLAGAVYGIYKGETLVDKYVTDKNGQFTTKEYICDDDWTIREITPSEGYLLDGTIHKVGAEPQLYTVEHNQTANDVTEQVMKGNIAIIKHTDDGETKIETPENGATFEIYLKSSGSFDAAEEDERDVIVCDENGFGQTKDMPYGVYTVHQTSGWEGRELMDDFDVFISQNGQTYRYLINNANFESYIKVVKVDAESGKNIPYAGAGFKIFDPDGNQVTMTFTYPTPTTIDTFYTDANGQLVTPEKLEYGKGYSLVEVQAPYGYVLDSTPVYFDVAEEHSSDEGGITVIKVDKPNMAQKGTVSIEKTGEVFSGVNISGEENADVIYQPVYEVKGLAGAVYEITAAEDIITPDGTLRYAKGEVVDTVTTDENGLAKSKELYLGKYTVVEITAPEGMVINKEAHEVELTYAGQEVAVTETATSFVNERQKVSVSLEKAIEKNDIFNIGNGDEMKNISFGLFAAEELVSASGTSIPADGLIEIISLSENGKAVIKTDLPFGSYYVKELATDEHYILSDSKYPFTFSYAGQDTETVEIAVNEGKPIENKLIYGSVSGKKITENGEELGGAVIGLFKADETEFTNRCNKGAEEVRI